MTQKYNGWDHNDLACELANREIDGLDYDTVVWWDDEDLIDALRANDTATKAMSYPVSKAKCEGCSACQLVTETFCNVARLDPSEYYYSCLAGAESDCQPEE